MSDRKEGEGRRRGDRNNKGQGSGNRSSGNGGRRDRDRNRRGGDRNRNNATTEGKASNSDINHKKTPIILAKNPDRNIEFPSLPQVQGFGPQHPSDSSQTQSPFSGEPNKSLSPGLDIGLEKKSSSITVLSSGDIRSKSDSPALGMEQHLKPALLPTPTNNELFPNSFVRQERSCKMIDETHQTSESLSNFLTDNTDFLVIGIIGPQSSGKSTILNNLINEGFEKNVFRVQNFDRQMLSEHGTVGLNGWISPERVLYLDCQPLNSASVFSRGLQMEKRFSAEFNYAETTIEIHSLQLMGLLMNVCHILIFVQDYFTDASMLQLIRTAEMLKPSSPTFSQDDISSITEYHPDFVFVQNKCQLEDFTGPKIREMTEFYEKVFDKSQLNLHTNLGMGIGCIMDHLPSEILNDSSFNLFLLPDFELAENSTNHLQQSYQRSWKTFDLSDEEFSFQNLVSKLRALILSSTKKPLTTNLKLTEKMWFSFFLKSWENVKNSNLYVEYSRIM